MDETPQISLQAIHLTMYMGGQAGSCMPKGLLDQASAISLRCSLQHTSWAMKWEQPLCKRMGFRKVNYAVKNQPLSFQKWGAKLH